MVYVICITMAGDLKALPVETIVVSMAFPGYLL